MSAKLTYRIPVGNGESVELDEVQGRRVNETMRRRSLTFSSAKALQAFIRRGEHIRSSFRLNQTLQAT